MKLSKRISLIAFMGCLSQISVGASSMEGDLAQEPELMKCQAMVDLLNDAFAYTKEELGSASGELTRDCCGGQEGALLQALLDQESCGKKKVIGFIDNVPVLETEDKGLTDKQKEFEKNYVRIFTLGNGLCFFHALGVQKTESPHGVSVINSERMFPYFKIIDERCRLANAYSIYEKRVKEKIAVLKKATSGSPAGSAVTEVSDVFQKICDFFNNKGKGLRDILQKFYYGNIEETGVKAEEQRNVDKSLKELRSLVDSGVQIVERLLYSHNSASAGEMRLVSDILVDLKYAISGDIMLTYSNTWPSYATLIPAYVNFSKTHCKKVALFYKEVIDDKDDVLPLCSWTILDKDPENAGYIYERIQNASNFEGKSTSIGAVEPSLSKLDIAKDEDLKQATDYVVLEMSHASRVIPRKFLEQVKGLLATKKDTLVVTVDEQGRIIHK